MAGSQGTSAVITVTGALKGVVRLPSYDATAGELRSEVARLLGVDNPSCLKMIASGKVLQDDTKSLSQYSVGPATKILISGGAVQQHSLFHQEAAQKSEEARLVHLERLKATVEKLASRGDGRGLTDKYEFSLENQSGAQLQLSAADRQALVLGLAMHEQARANLQAGKVQDALDALLVAESSFGVVTPLLLDSIDNLAMLLLDIVWCYFKLKDISRLGVCGERLAAARRMLEKAHGPHQERLRQLHGSFSPEQTTYVRLELLEGVVAFHSDQQQLAQQKLGLARDRWLKLQVPEGPLLQLAELGYSHKAASRALRFCGGDLAAAVDFLTAQQEKQELRREERAKQRRWQQERMQYGQTDGGKYLDQQSLQQLVSLGYDKPVAAEALRQCENDANAALDALTDARQRGALQLAVATQQAIADEFGPQWVKAKHVRRLCEMGYLEKEVRKALAAAGNKLMPALEQLQVLGKSALAGTCADAEGAITTGTDGSTTSGAAGAASASKRARKVSSSPGRDALQTGAEPGAARHGRISSDGGSSEEEDDELTAEVIKTVAGKGKDDPLAAYDIDVEEDGQVIQMYLSMLATSTEAAACPAAAQ